MIRVFQASRMPHLQSICCIFWLFKSDALFQFLDEVLVKLNSWVRVLPQAEYFPHNHTEGPDVTLGGEQAILQTLQGQPLHWDRTLGENNCFSYLFTLSVTL